MVQPAGVQPLDVHVGRHLALVAARYKIDVATAEACTSFADRGVPAIVLKGPATARVLYENDDRFYGDADILIEQEHRQLAASVLRDLGFTETLPATRLKRWVARQTEGKDRGFYRESDGVGIELHRSFHLVPQATNLHGVLAEHQDHMTVAGASVAVPNRAAVGLLCLLHAQGSTLDGRAGDRLANDVHRAIEQLTPDEWTEAAEIARQLKADAYCVAALNELGGEPGAELARQLFPGVRPDRWLTTHLRTGSLTAFKRVNFRSRTWKSRAVWCLTRILPFARP
jgi:Uncharacterised nucleotidyltransferase